MAARSPGTQYALDEDYDVVRAGARLKLSFDEASNAFTGTVENTTANTLTRVRVEVHLSNGIELGPTTPLDLASGQTVPVRLPASSESSRPGARTRRSARTVPRSRRAAPVL